MIEELQELANLWRISAQRAPLGRFGDGQAQAYINAADDLQEIIDKHRQVSHETYGPHTK